jgi:hypothetical protein
MITSYLENGMFSLHLYDDVQSGPTLNQLDPAMALSTLDCSSTHNSTLHVLQRIIGCAKVGPACNSL